MKKGFTLSEVLITLGIVGVVAVLTIPAVMKNYKNRLYTAQLRKVYAQVSDAAQAIMNDEHCPNFYETTAGSATSCSNANKGECEKGSGYFLNKYFKTVKKNCNKNLKSLCVSVGNNGKPDAMDSYKDLNGTNAGVLAGDYCVQTTNGAAICATYANGVTSLNIDVNGPSSPNVTGRDVFWVDILPSGLVVDHRTNGVKPDKTKCGIGSSAGCLTSVIEAGWKMEY